MELNEKYGKQALTLEETAKELGVSVPDLDLLIENGELSVKKIGERTLVPIISLERYLGLAESADQSYTTEPNGEEEVFRMETPHSSGSILYVKARDEFRYAISRGKDPVTGKRERLIKGGFRTREDAEAALQKALKEMDGLLPDSGVSSTVPSTPPTPNAPRITVRDYLDKNLLSFYPKAKPRTLNCYVSAAHTLVGLIGDLYLDELNRSNLQEALNSISYYSKSTLQKVYLVLKKMVVMAVEDELIPRNVANNVECPRSTQVDNRSEDDKIYSKEQIAAILNAAKEEDDPLLFTILIVFLFTGMRPEELRGLRKQDYVPEIKKLYIRQAATTEPILDKKNALSSKSGKRTHVIGETKSKAGKRDFDLSPELVDTLENWLQYLKHHDPVRSESELLFPNSEGGILRDDVLNTKFRRFKKRHGFEKGFKLYRFRHTFCSTLLENQTDLKTIMRLMGDSTAKVILETYCHAPNRVVQEANKKINGVYSDILSEMMVS